MRWNQVGSRRTNNTIVCGLQSLMIGVTPWLGRKSPSAALRNSTSKLDFETLLCLSSQPDGSPDYVTSVSVSEPAMHLPPVYVDGQISVVTRMRRKIELYKMVQPSCPGIQGMALACMGETPSAPPAGGGSSAPTVSMTPVGPGRPPQFPPPQHQTDDPERRNVNFSGRGHEGSHRTRGSRDDQFHAQHDGQHHQGHRGARGQGFKRCDELGGVADSLRYTYNGTPRVRQLALGCESN